jgi:hypothetical protein
MVAFSQAAESAAAQSKMARVNCVRHERMVRLLLETVEFLLKGRACGNDEPE